MKLVRLSQATVEREKVNSLNVEKWVESEFVILYIFDQSPLMYRSPKQCSGSHFCQEFQLITSWRDVGQSFHCGETVIVTQLEQSFLAGVKQSKLFWNILIVQVTVQLCHCHVTAI